MEVNARDDRTAFPSDDMLTFERSANGLASPKASSLIGSFAVVAHGLANMQGLLGRCSLKLPCQHIWSDYYLGGHFTALGDVEICGIMGRREGCEAERLIRKEAGSVSYCSCAAKLSD